MRNRAGTYFAFAVVYAIQNENYATTPFLLLFVWGYLYTGLMSLAQVYLSASASALQTLAKSAPPPPARRGFSCACEAGNRV